MVGGGGWWVMCGGWWVMVGGGWWSWVVGGGQSIEGSTASPSFPSNDPWPCFAPSSASLLTCMPKHMTKSLWNARHAATETQECVTSKLNFLGNLMSTKLKGYNMLARISSACGGAAGGLIWRRCCGGAAGGARPLWRCGGAAGGARLLWLLSSNPGGCTRSTTGTAAPLPLLPPALPLLPLVLLQLSSSHTGTSI